MDYNSCMDNPTQNPTNSPVVDTDTNSHLTALNARLEKLEQLIQAMEGKWTTQQEQQILNTRKAIQEEITALLEVTDEPPANPPTNPEPPANPEPPKTKAQLMRERRKRKVF